MKIRHVGFLALALGILAAPGMAQKQAGKPSPASELKALTEQYQKAEQGFFEPLSRAKTDAEREKIQLDWKKHPAAQFIPKFQGIARRAQGTDTGARALVWVMRLGRTVDQRQAVQEAMKQLVDSYARSIAIGEAVSEIRYLGWMAGVDQCEAALRKIAAQSPHREIKASSLYGLGSMLAEYPKTPERRTEARQLFETIKKDYADTRYAKEADGYIFEMERLQIGMAAPEIEATDQDGKSFKLSDYRGKVVVLDFWGFW
jgi:hypothetical protein